MCKSFINKIDQEWTLFLDRDGVINRRIFGGYVKEVGEFEFLHGVTESIANLSEVFGRIIVVTNQQGVGKNIMTENDLIVVHNHLISEINKAGGKIDDIIYCTKLESEKDNCRKPNNFMAIKATEKFPEIDLKKSIMVGDSLSDIQFGINSGMRTVYVKSSEINQNAIEAADLVVDSLIEFKNVVSKNKLG